MLDGKTIILGVTACSPAIKSLDLIKALKKLGAEVHVVMTPNAVNFVSPLLVQREAGTPLQLEQFELPKAFDQNHKSLSVQADLLLIAPASANTLGKAANGIGDNLLSTKVLSVNTPIVVATHINPIMYKKASVQRNVKQLKEDGFIFVDNGDKEKPSKFPSIEKIVETVKAVLV